MIERILFFITLLLASSRILAQPVIINEYAEGIVHSKVDDQLIRIYGS